MTDPKEQIKWLEEKIEDNGRQVEQWKDNPAFKNLVTSVCTEIKIVREIPLQEFLALVNEGSRNTGWANKGNSNVGNGNKGNSNVGNWRIRLPNNNRKTTS